MRPDKSFDDFTLRLPNSPGKNDQTRPTMTEKCRASHSKTILGLSQPHLQTKRAHSLLKIAE
jgi:hypothetical protein